MRQTIKKYKDFIIQENNSVVKTPLFIIRSRPTLWDGNAKYGLVTTKKTFRLACERNRAKRLLRVWIRACESLMNPDMDYIFIARTSILNTTLSIGIETMKKALQQLSNNDEKNRPALN
ncbi:MAG: ribonuclease P protein component [Alphaproteobacteria bacterium]|jgi:ribonuclease P protein component